MADAAFEHEADIELAGDVANVELLALVGEARIAGYHHEAGDLGEVSDIVFGDAVAEVILGWIARHIVEGQYGDRWSRVRGFAQGSLSGRRSVGVAWPPFPDRDRPIDVLDLNLSAIPERGADPIADAFVHDRGDANPTGLGERLQPRRDIDAVAVNVVLVDDDVAEVDANANMNRGLAFGQYAGRDRVLDSNRAFDRVDDARKFDQRPIADQFDDAPVMSGDLWIEETFAELLERRERAGLIGGHQTRIADDVSRQNGRQPSIGLGLRHCLVPPIRAGGFPAIGRLAATAP